ncbi:ornithine cyclodeaminase family protein [Flavobacterium sp. FlaQc-52]|jgi:ornithine cyclodeaminase/alanine dehydrogenase-like protein (mu-crystallin family)|uniref:ornithine cyclodeaminase family protein n=1 Tax=Flavobacterium sp. FlaQc-52 TaxID=3374185 RepID=UPI003756D067
MTTIPFISDSFIAENCDYKTLVEVLQKGFSNTEIEVPMRHHHDFPNPEEKVDSTLLLMPAFHPGNDLGVKIVTVSPNNGNHNLPSIQGIYVYLDAHLGHVKAILEAKALTAARTAAVSALASSYLSRTDASTLFMIGTGALATNLIRAHASVRPITKVYVWGRNPAKAKLVCDSLKEYPFTCETVGSIENTIPKAHIISCATLSKTPLVFGEWLQEGQHLDLVGAYKKDIREADDAAISRASVFIDTYQGGLKESGDIVIPLQTNVIKVSDIKADLFELCSGIKKGRTTDHEITFFKSVGHALEDLVAAAHFYEKYSNAK